MTRCLILTLETWITRCYRNTKTAILHPFLVILYLQIENSSSVILPCIILFYIIWLYVDFFNNYINPYVCVCYKSLGVNHTKKLIVSFYTYQSSLLFVHCLYVRVWVPGAEPIISDMCGYVFVLLFKMSLEHFSKLLHLLLSCIIVLSWNFWTKSCHYSSIYVMCHAIESPSYYSTVQEEFIFHYANWSMNIFL